jgi:hypothetical protein
MTWPVGIRRSFYYHVTVGDPPWAFENDSAAGTEKGTDQPGQAIKDLARPQDHQASKKAEDHHVDPTRCQALVEKHGEEQRDMGGAVNSRANTVASCISVMAPWPVDVATAAPARRRQ